MKSTYSEKLAAFVEKISYRDLPADVIQMAKNCFLDWLGCVYGSRNDRGVRSMVEVARISKGSEHATVIPCGEKNSALLSALVNGAAAHALELDDVHRDSVLHAAAVVIPAVFAVGEREHISGEGLIEAIVSGYEVMIRVGEGVGRSHYWFWHNTSTCGTFGSAAGVGRILGLTVDQYVHALGNAGSQSSGLWEFLQDGANTKLLHTGKAAMNGIIAADLAQRNFTGARQIFEGERGFFLATSKDADPDRLIQGFDQEPIGYKIISNSFKLYPSCRHTHSPIDATLALFLKHDIRWEAVERVEVYTYSGAINLCSGVELKNPYVAKWHIPFAVATALKYRQVTLDSYSEARLREQALLDLADKVTLRLDPELDARYPSQWPARVEIYTKGAGQISTTVYSPKGDPDNPPTKEELNNKFRNNASFSLPSHVIEELIEKVDHIERQSDISDLLRNVQIKD
jgi:2-methylcitrate dehydratase PrpD